jgi:hypothetical protein
MVSKKSAAHWKTFLQSAIETLERIQKDLTSLAANISAEATRGNETIPYATAHSFDIRKACLRTLETLEKGSSGRETPLEAVQLALKDLENRLKHEELTNEPTGLPSPPGKKPR